MNNEKTFLLFNVHMMPFCLISFQVNHMDLTGQHRAFIAEILIKNGFVTMTQGAFRSHYKLRRYDPFKISSQIFMMIEDMILR